MMMDRLNQLRVGLLRYMLTDSDLGCLLAIDGAFPFPRTPLSSLGLWRIRKLKSTTSPNTVSTPARVGFSFEETARSTPSPKSAKQHLINRMSQVFRFSTSKNESLFLQRKNPRKISWTVPYRRLHKKGITEEVAKKRSRKTVKHQRGIVGADMASIQAKRNQSAQIRTAQRTAAIQKAKSEKKEKEAKKPKVRFRRSPHHTACVKP